jgi:beta-lactam-binding protein with PASTA domain
METILGIEIFPLISFIIFFVFFCVLFIWVIQMKKTEVDALAALPFDKDSNDLENHSNLKK